MCATTVDSGDVCVLREHAMSPPLPSRSVTPSSRGATPTPLPPGACPMDETEEFETDIGTVAEEGLRGIKSIPIHVVVETVPICGVTLEGGAGAGGGDGRGRLETDSYALIPAHARFDDLLQIVLLKTGFIEDMSCARGLLQLRHWRGVPLEQVAADSETTVGEVLGELAALATLHVRIYSSPRTRSCRSVRERLLRVLLAQSQHMLASAGCPLEQSQVAALVRGCPDQLPDEALRQFETWWALQIAHASTRPPPPPPPTHSHLPQHPHHPQQPPHTPTSMHNQTPHMHAPSPHLHASSPHHHHSQSTSHSGMAVLPSLQQTGGLLPPASHPHHVGEHNPLQEPLHPALQGISSAAMLGLPKTRMRTSFDPEFELPRLQRWFAENQHPTRLQIQQYVAELNGLESRRGRKPLDINNVVYWFKNARAAYKRQEFRSLNGIKSPPPEDLSDTEDFPPSQTNPATPPHHHLNSHNNAPHQNGAAPSAPLTLNSTLVTSVCSSSSCSSASSSTLGSSAQPLNLQTNTTNYRGGSGSGSSCNNGSNGVNNSNVTNDEILNNNNNNNSSNNNNSKEFDDGCSNGVVRSSSAGGGGGSKSGGDPNEDGGSPSVGATAVDGDVDTGLNQGTKRKFKDEDDVLVKEETVQEPTQSSPTLNPPLFSRPPHSLSPSPASGRPLNGMEGASGEEGVGPDSSPMNSDVDMSDDEDGRSRDSIVVTESKNSPSPIMSPGGGGLGLPPYPPLVGLQGGVERFAASTGYPVMPSSLLQQSMMYMAHYMPQVPPFPGALMPHGSIPEERRKRNRTFIDPVTEVPRLEQWFNLNTHPSHNLILKYTEELNRMHYRQKFPRLEPKNVQFWFKNRRAKCKRLRVAI